MLQLFHACCIHTAINPAVNSRNLEPDCTHSQLCHGPEFCLWRVKLYTWIWKRLDWIEKAVHWLWASFCTRVLGPKGLSDYHSPFPYWYQSQRHIRELLGIAPSTELNFIRPKPYNKHHNKGTKYKTVSHAVTLSNGSSMLVTGTLHFASPFPRMLPTGPTPFWHHLPQNSTFRSSCKMFRWVRTDMSIEDFRENVQCSIHLNWFSIWNIFQRGITLMDILSSSHCVVAYIMWLQHNGSFSSNIFHTVYCQGWLLPFMTCANVLLHLGWNLKQKLCARVQQRLHTNSARHHWWCLCCTKWHLLHWLKTAPTAARCWLQNSVWSRLLFWAWC